MSKLKESYSRTPKGKTRYFKKHSQSRAKSRFGYSRKDIAKILKLIKTNKYKSKSNNRGRVRYTLIYLGEYVDVIYDPRIRQIVTFLGEENDYEKHKQ